MFKYKKIDMKYWCSVEKNAKSLRDSNRHQIKSIICSNVSVLAGNAMFTFFMTQCVLLDNPQD